MAAKDHIKLSLPPKLYNIAKTTHNVFSSYRYWIPYRFMNGKALYPLNANYEVTYKCNLNCVMCPQAISKTRGKVNKVLQNELSLQETISMMNELSHFGIKNLTLTGGEPLLNKNILDIISYANSCGIHCTINTNGTLISEDLAHGLIESGINKIVFSLDGPLLIHEAVRGVKGCFNKMMEGIRYIKEAKIANKSNIPILSLTCTLSAINSNWLVETYEIAKQMNINIVFGYLFYTTEAMIHETNKIFPVGSSKPENQDIKEELKKINSKDLLKSVDQIKKLSRGSNIRVSFQPDLKGNEIDRWFNDSSFTFANKCFYPWRALRINPYGDVYPCSMGIKMGNVKSDNIKSIWNGKNYQKFRQSLKDNKLFPKCSKCCALNNKVWNYLP